MAAGFGGGASRSARGVVLKVSRPSERDGKVVVDHSMVMLITIVFPALSALKRGMLGSLEVDAKRSMVRCLGTTADTAGE